MNPKVGQQSHTAPVDDGVGVEASLAELVSLRGTSARIRSRNSIALSGPGNHVSIRHGRGMEFAEVRPYQAGDDPRTVDWRHTARRGRLYTKLFHEEHERPVRLLVDLSATMRFGTRVAFKSVVAARVAAWLAWRAIDSGDRIGGLVWTGDKPQEIPPRSRQQGALAFLRRVADATAPVDPSILDSTALPLSPLLRTLRSGGLNIIISDFATLNSEVERQITTLAGVTDLMLVHIHDPFEAQPEPGRYRLTDGHRLQTIDLRSAQAREAFCADFNKRCAALEQLSQRCGASLVRLATHDDIEGCLVRALARPKARNR